MSAECDECGKDYEPLVGCEFCEAQRLLDLREAQLADCTRAMLQVSQAMRLNALGLRDYSKSPMHVCNYADSLVALAQQLEAVRAGKAALKPSSFDWETEFLVEMLNDDEFCQRFDAAWRQGPDERREFMTKAARAIAAKLDAVRNGANP